MNNYIEQTEKVEMKFFGYIIGEILRTIRGKAFVGAFIQCFCLIGYLSELSKNNYDEKDSESYKNFIKNHLKGYDPEKLYAIRCALVHTYGYAEAMKKAYLSGYSFTHKNPELHLKEIKTNGYHLNLSNFVYDIIKTTYDFFNEIKQEASKENQEKYMYKTKNLIGVIDPSGERISANYAEADIVLSAMDTKNINWEIVRNEIYKLCVS